MKRFLRWLERISSRLKAPVEADQPSSPVSVEDIAMPEIYADKPVAKVAELKTLVPSSPDADETVGFNPYDTAVLQKK
jgi:hypothetical protein